MNNSFRFAFVSNSLAIAQSVRDYASSRKLSMEIRQANMEDAIPVAKSLIDDGVSVVLGGGGAGRILRRHLLKPVVTIGRTHLDIIQALMKAREYSPKIAFTCYGPVPRWTALFARLLYVSLSPVPFTSTPELVSGIAMAIEQGAGVIAGGGICVEIARAKGCPGVIIAPGEESLERAMDEAVNIARSQQRDHEHNAWLQGALDALHEGVIGIDIKGRETISNKSANSILPAISSHELENGDIGKKLGLEHTLRSGHKNDGIVRRISGVELVINTVPVQVNGVTQGALAAFMPSARVRDLSHKMKNASRATMKAKYDLDSLKGSSALMAALKKRATQYANSDMAIHIHGESGTGKELLAQGIHRASNRSRGAFVAVNCGALPESLLESELFGYEEGAFTGARKGGKTGLLELAQDGTVFLDEIADISPGVQAKLLRVLETGEIFRLGGISPVLVNARVISSTWKDLACEVRSGRFRPDLYYRLTPLRLATPPLRLRPEDISEIAADILTRAGLSAGFLSTRAVSLLMDYSWPGNVRELDAVLRRFSLLGSRVICDDELLESLMKELEIEQGYLSSPPVETDLKKYVTGAGTGDLKARMCRVEKEIIAGELLRCGNNRMLAAHNLGISTNTLWRKTRYYEK